MNNLQPIDPHASLRLPYRSNLLGVAFPVWDFHSKTAIAMGRAVCKNMGVCRYWSKIRKVEAGI